MRILLLSDLYPPVVGGLEVHVQSLARELVRRGHSVAVATQGQPGVPALREEEGVRVHRIEGWSRALARRYEDPAYRFLPPAPDPGMTRALRRVVREERPEVVHAHSWIVYSFAPIKAASRAALVMTLHDYGLACARKTFWQVDRRCSGPSLAKCLRCAAGQYGAPRATALVTALRGSAELHRTVDRFVAVSGSVAAAAAGVARGRPVSVVPNFLAPGIESLGASGPRPAFLPADDGYVLFAGALSGHKGVEHLVAAHALLGDAPPLVLVGPPAGAALAARPGVVVAGGASREAVMAAFRRAAVAVVPSVWDEPCPTVALEAMSCGVPVVASRVGGLPDILGDEEAGLLVPPADPRALAAALGRVLHDAELRGRLAAGARRRAASFTAEAVVPRIETLYADAAGARRAA